MAEPKKAPKKTTKPLKTKEKPTKPVKAVAAKAPAKGSKRSGTTTVMTAHQVGTAIETLAAQLHGEFPTPERLVILGIRTRGVFIAERLRAALEARYRAPVSTGILDIAFYRDDLSQKGPNPMVRGSELPHDIHDAYVVLVDDVLYTGRTIRAAMDEISDFGRPALIRLVTLVDRGLREYPIQPDHCALKLTTLPNQRVHVLLQELDEEDRVVLESL